MWTLNSERTLGACLQSIENAIPSDVVNQRIMIDAYSKDGTKTIGETFGWKVYDAEKVGIISQANQALSHVTTDFFASFEHDIILNPHWLSSMFTYMLDPKVAVAQGVRLSTNLVLRKIEMYSLGRDEIRYSSVDNNLYNTKIIREIGGFTGYSRELQDTVWKHGYEWITDKRIVSNHVRGTLLSTGRHIYNFGLLSAYRETHSFSGQLARFLFSPVRSLHIALSENCPQAIYAYPYIRFAYLASAIKRHASRLTSKKKIKNRFSS
jgi:glycosyltransferase involved in cell wall biosynthesis